MMNSLSMNGPPTCYVFNAIANVKNNHKEVAKLAFFLNVKSDEINFFIFAQ